MHSRLLKRHGWFTGNCDSRDQFFVARGHVAEGDIRKAAFSNWITNGVTRLAGIRNPSPEMLMTAGLKPERIQSIDYSGRRTPEKEAEVISDAQGKRLWAIAREHGVSEESLKKKLGEEYGIEHLRDILRRDYDGIVLWVEKYTPSAPKDEPKRPGRPGAPAKAAEDTPAEAPKPAPSSTGPYSLPDFERDLAAAVSHEQVNGLMTKLYGANGLSTRLTPDAKKKLNQLIVEKREALQGQATTTS